MACRLTRARPDLAAAPGAASPYPPSAPLQFGRACFQFLRILAQQLPIRLEYKPSYQAPTCAARFRITAATSGGSGSLGGIHSPAICSVECTDWRPSRECPKPSVSAFDDAQPAWQRRGWVAMRAATLRVFTRPPSRKQTVRRFGQSVGRRVRSGTSYSPICLPTSRNRSAGRSNRSGVRTALR
jgi:hypothetical protein